MTATKTRPHYATSYSQARHLQSLLLQDADKEDLRPAVRASLARAFCELEETIRVLKMRPLPKSVDPEQWKNRRRSRRPKVTLLDQLAPAENEPAKRDNTTQANAPKLDAADTQKRTPPTPEADQNAA